MNFSQQFIAEVQQVTAQLNADAIEKCADELAKIRERGGRLFILGVGGSAGNAGHAVNDFRKICGRMMKAGQRFFLNGSRVRG